MTNHTHPIQTPHLGNGLAASKPLDPGDLIVQIPSPYLLVVEKEALDRVCSYCLHETPLSSLKRCSSCKIVRYCTPTCQKEDWKLIHKRECGVLAKLPAVPPTAVRALFQYLVRYGGEGLDERSEGLESHWEEFKRDQKRWDEIVLQARGAVAFSRTKESKMEMVTRLLCVLSTNAFRATLPDDTPIGLCYTPTLALANHSCTPNAFIIFSGRRISLHALSPIPLDGQIFISYIDFTQSLDIRQTELKQRYFFTCSCPKCTQDLNPYEVFASTPTEAVQNEKISLLTSHPDLLSQANQKIPIIKRLKEELAPLLEDLSKVQPLITLSHTNESPRERFNFLTQMHLEMSLFRDHNIYALPPYPTVLDEIYLAYVDASRLAAALIILLFIFLNCDVVNWPQGMHPVRVARLFTISRLLKYVSSLSSQEREVELGCVERGVLEGVDWIDGTHVVLVVVSELATLSYGVGSVFV
ncbi:hypothetical protein HYALB_00011769 [Hymenoscyphus albidus]|uniref:MYND-type zinc finger protein samB n=1 Tax=Hymenoscyphus albidus TaxID=595503 RepID=A0A9N9LPY7_9HELO|nr:hypothetical protein HYALB_00011769 [Hymenoscyphus albidus]